LRRKCCKSVFELYSVTTRSISASKSFTAGCCSSTVGRTERREIGGGWI
jgi:hypothetical protein